MSSTSPFLPSSSFREGEGRGSVLGGCVSPQGAKGVSLTTMDIIPPIPQRREEGRPRYYGYNVTRAIATRMATLAWYCLTVTGYC
jgi:hypothetical protein